MLREGARKLFVWLVYILLLLIQFPVVIVCHGIASIPELFEELRTLDPDGEDSRIRKFVDKIFGSK